MNEALVALLISTGILSPVAFLVWIATRPDGHWTPRERRRPNSALQSDPVFGWFLILGLSGTLAMIHWSIGLAFFCFALYLGTKPFEAPRS